MNIDSIVDALENAQYNLRTTQRAPESPIGQCTLRLALDQITTALTELYKEDEQ